MAIPSVIGGTVETDTGKVIELDSPKGVAWLETIGSFRYEPTGDGKPYTVRKEGKNGEYWYGCRKIEGKVRKKYIGKSSEVSVVKLEEIAEALEIPAEPRAKQVAEVAQEVPQSNQVVDRVAEVAQDRLATLESQMAMVLKAVEALQEALPGKSEAGDSEELPKVVDKVADKVVEELQNELGNLKTENENLRRSLERSDTVIRLRNQEIAKLNSRLAAKDETIAELGEQIDRLESELQRRSDLANSQTLTSKNPIPDAADLLNRLKARRKKSKAELADIEKILEILEGEG